MMEMTFTLESTFDSKAVAERVKSAMELGLRDLTVKVTRDTIVRSRHVTGNNRRSIAYNVGMEMTYGDMGGGGVPAPGRTFTGLEPPPPPLTAYVYSTSGYGGYLETGTRRMLGIPYFKPALDMNIDSYGDMVGKYLK